MVPETFHHLLVCYDIQESAKLENSAKMQMRRLMRDSLEAALEAASIPVASVAVLDRGDGAIVLMDATVSKQRVLDTWLGTFHDRIQRSYEKSPLRCQIRLAIHAGEIHAGPDGYAGPDLDFTCRLVDAPVVRHILNATPSAGLAVIVSDSFYYQVVRHAAPAVSPASFSKVGVRVKETDTTAWLYLPGWTRVPVPPRESSEHGDHAAESGVEGPVNTTPSARQGTDGLERVVVTGTVGVVGATTVNGPFTVNGPKSVPNE